MVHAFCCPDSVLFYMFSGMQRWPFPTLTCYSCSVKQCTEGTAGPYGPCRNIRLMLVNMSSPYAEASTDVSLSFPRSTYLKYCTTRGHLHDSEHAENVQAGAGRSAAIGMSCGGCKEGSRAVQIHSAVEGIRGPCMVPGDPGCTMSGLPVYGTAPALANVTEQMHLVQAPCKAARCYVSSAVRSWPCQDCLSERDPKLV